MAILGVFHSTFYPLPTWMTWRDCDGATDDSLPDWRSLAVCRGVVELIHLSPGERRGLILRGERGGLYQDAEIIVIYRDSSPSHPGILARACASATRRK